MLKNLFFGLVAALLFSFNVHASIPPTSTTEYSCGYGWYPSAHAALAAHPSTQNGTFGQPWRIDVFSCYATRMATGVETFLSNSSLRTVNSCPANSTLVGSVCVCSSGYNQVGNVCVNAQCEVGKGRTFNRTEGWARTSGADANDVVSNIGPPAGIYDFNDGVCVGNITSIDKCFRSQEPSTQGLYRISCDYTMVVTGDSSSGGDPATSPATPDAACPGFVGEVNGKAVCVGTASSPLPSPSNAPNEPTAPGNPAAGVKPSTGPGSGADGPGRTPTTGAGGNAGGPAGAAVGRGGTGDRGENGADGEDAKAVCGAPPLPACNVKVDETGTPTAASAEGLFSGPGAGVDEQKGLMDGLLNTIESWDIGNWTWTFALPTGCVAFEIEMAASVSVDPCRYQETIHDLMSVIWVLTGICAAFIIFERGAA
jgi:hypothetical protein